MKATEAPRDEYMNQFKKYNALEEQLHARGRRLDQSRKNRVENASLAGFDEIQCQRSIEDVSN